MAIIKLINISSTSHTYIFVVRTFKIFFLSIFKWFETIFTICFNIFSEKIRVFRRDILEHFTSPFVETMDEWQPLLASRETSHRQFISANFQVNIGEIMIGFKSL